MLLVAERGRVGEKMVGAGKEIVSVAQRAEILGTPKINAERRDAEGAEFPDRLEDMPVMSRRISGEEQSPGYRQEVAEDCPAVAEIEVGCKQIEGRRTGVPDVGDVGERPSGGTDVVNATLAGYE